MERIVKSMKSLSSLSSLSAFSLRENKDCIHVSKEEWIIIMKAMLNTDRYESLVLVDGFNALPLYVPSHHFKYYYPYNEFDDSPPLFYEDKQYLKWIEKQIRSKTFFLRIHVCDPMELMKKIVIQFKNLTKISLHFFILSNDCIKFLVQNFPNLKAINFENSIGIKSEECLLLSQLSDLQHLNLMGCDIYEENLEVLLKNCPQLKSLNINNNSDISGQCLYSISPSIERLDLRDCWGIDFQHIIAMVERLKLNSLVEFLANSGISNDSLTAICENCPNIRHLTISFDYFTCDDIYGRRVLSNSGFSSIGKLENLKILNLRHVGKLTDESLHNILKGCKNLMQLVLNVRHRHQLTDNALSNIGVCCPKLLRLESVHNHFIGKKSMKSISQIENLVALILRGNKMVDNDITEAITECKRLSFLNLDGCPVNQLVLMSCIQKAIEIQPNDQILTVSLLSTQIDRSALNEHVLPPNLRIRVSGPQNYEHFLEFDGKNVLEGKLSWFFPQYWTDFID